MRVTIRIALFLILAGLASTSIAQSYAFGLKGGLTLGVQQWNSFDRDPLFKYHGIAFIESYDEADLFSVFAQAGYHIKGSAIRNSVFSLGNGNTVKAPTQEFQFRNLSLTLGGKKKYDLNSTKAYYMLGIRGDYTLSTNLSEYEEVNQFLSFYPSDNWVRKWNYGVTFGGGFEFPFAELMQGLIEFTVNPDFSRQYWQPAIPNVPNPRDPANSLTIPERKINNITFELTLGLRFIRLVEYID
ncbi:MAG: hypothetical protein KDC43_04290 [Saprospiraceae bacterium]|nr:hypothetical protein [Saprospiraceae bacterium]